MATDPVIKHHPAAVTSDPVLPEPEYWMAVIVFGYALPPACCVRKVLRTWRTADGLLRPTPTFPMKLPERRGANVQGLKLRLRMSHITGVGSRSDDQELF